MEDGLPVGADEIDLFQPAPRALGDGEGGRGERLPEPDVEVGQILDRRVRGRQDPFAERRGVWAALERAQGELDAARTIPKQDERGVDSVGRRAGDQPDDRVPIATPKREEPLERVASSSRRAARRVQGITISTPTVSRSGFGIEVGFAAAIRAHFPGEP